jgi:hypothetical protein
MQPRHIPHQTRKWERITLNERTISDVSQVRGGGISASGRRSEIIQPQRMRTQMIEIVRQSFFGHRTGLRIFQGRFADVIACYVKSGTDPNSQVTLKAYN